MVTQRMVAIGNDVLTIEDAERRIAALAAGESFVYYTGDIGRDRDERKSDCLTDRARQVKLLAAYMLRQGTPPEFSFGDGCVTTGTWRGTLTRRRHGPHLYDYIFTKGKGKGPCPRKMPAASDSRMPGEIR